MSCLVHHSCFPLKLGFQGLTYWGFWCLPLACHQYSSETYLTPPYLNPTPALLIQIFVLFAELLPGNLLHVLSFISRSFIFVQMRAWFLASLFRLFHFFILAILSVIYWEFHPSNLQACQELISPYLSFLDISLAYEDGIYSLVTGSCAATLGIIFFLTSFLAYGL